MFAGLFLSMVFLAAIFLAALWAGGAHAADTAGAGAATRDAGTPIRSRISGGAQSGAAAVEIQLDSEDGEEKFLYLKSDFGIRPTASGIDLGARQDGEIDILGGLGTFTPRYANVRLGYGTASQTESPAPSGFDIALTSQMAIGGPPAFDPLGFGLTSLRPDDRALNLGFSVGYAGFNFGARYLYGDDILNYGYRGYDVGLGYDSGTWGTTLGFSGIAPNETSAGLDLLGTQSLYSVRLGAFYQISPGLTLGGRFQYHDYRLFDSADTQNRGEFFLNTNVNF